MTSHNLRHFDPFPLFYRNRWRCRHLTDHAEMLEGCKRRDDVVIALKNLARNVAKTLAFHLRPIVDSFDDDSILKKVICVLNLANSSNQIFRFWKFDNQEYSKRMIIQEITFPDRKKINIWRQMKRLIKCTQTCGSTQISVIILSSLSSAGGTSSASSSDDDMDEQETSETVVVAVYGGKTTYLMIN